jgi:predicted metalloprotease with PDZ domain
MQILRLLALTPLALLAACAAAPHAPAPASPLAEYRVRLLDPPERAAEVELRLSGLPVEPAEVQLALPESYAFLKLEAPLLGGEVRARGPDGQALPLEREGPFRWRLHTAGSASATLTWRALLTAHDRPDVAARDAYEHPYVAADHALLVTGAFLLAPELGREPALRVRFQGPRGWPVLCPWPEAEPGVYAPSSTAELQHDLVALGGWSARRLRAGGMAIDLAFAPGQPDLERLAAPIVEQVCSAELALFGVTPRPRYLFLFVAPQDARGGFSFAGSPKTGSMALQVSGDLTKPIATELVAHLVAHEFHHTWAASRLDFGDALRFVGEGFTDWYAHLLPARAGLVPWPRFGEQLGGTLADWTSVAPALPASLSAAGGPEFFQGGDAYQATYRGGMLVALLIDLELRAAGRVDGLDGWLREFVNDPRWSLHERGPALDDFLAHVERALGSEGRARVARWVGERGGLDPLAELARLGVAVDEQAQPRTIRANFDGLRVVALDPACEAARLGLREGDVLRAVNDQTVADEREAQKAWREPAGGESVLRVQRGAESLELRAPAGSAPVKRTVDPSRWAAAPGPA